MTTEFDQSARLALAAIVADADLGPSVLSDPGSLSNLLSDYLPSSPRETGLLTAAAQADVAGRLREHAAHGMNPATAIRITAANLEARTAYPTEACMWVTGELAIAIGVTTADRLPQLVAPWQPTDIASNSMNSAVQSAPEMLAVPTSPLPLAESETGPPPPPAVAPRGRRKRGPIVVALTIVVLLAAAGSAALYYGRNGSSGSPPTARATPRQVVKAYIAAINQRNWHRVWRLGGKNIDASYSKMVAGYRHTKHVVIESLTVTRPTVTVRTKASETTGAVQTYLLIYKVSRGVIVSGSQDLLSTSHAQGGG
jgi:hypothetical protein